MTEMLAALLGALVGGLLSASVGSRQDAKVLKHETELAATERREARHADEDRRRSVAADQLIAALADYVTLSESRREKAAYFVRMATTEDAHRERDRRASALMQAGASYAHALPEQVRERWDDAREFECQDSYWRDDAESADRFADWAIEWVDQSERQRFINQHWPEFADR